MTPAPIQSADLSGIIERLQNATGPEREIDAQIWLATTPGATRNSLEVKSSKNLWPPYVIDETRDAGGRLTVVPASTASIDAAIALAERVMPAFQVNVTKYSYTIAKASLGASWMKPVMHVTPALALCLAVLRALQSKGEA